MAPCSLLTAAAGLMARSLTARCTSIICNTSINPVKFLSSETSAPPKRPLNGYMRYVVQQKPIEIRQNPEAKLLDLIRKIAQQWRLMSPEQKQPFQDASAQAMKQFREDFQKYQAQLTPVQLEQQAMEKRERMAKRKAIRKKRELNSLGKPKRPRTPFNIYMSEHYQEARGTTTQAKLKSLYDDWKNLFSHQQQVYAQLAEDDKIRYKNEIKSWENHMADIGRADLIREHARPKKKKKKKKKPVKSGKKATPTRKSSSKTKAGSSAKTVQKGATTKG